MVPNYRWQVEIVPALVRIRFSETSVCRSSEINRESLRFRQSAFANLPEGGGFRHVGRGTLTKP
jgi:hypothetical protein